MQYEEAGYIETGGWGMKRQDTDKKVGMV